MNKIHKVIPLVSVVINNWNRKDDLKEAILSIKNQSYPNTEIVVSDNHSDDGSIEMVRNDFPDIRLIVMPNSNYGAIETCNIGLASAKGQYVIMIDNDAVFVDFNTIEKMVDIFERNPKLGIISCMIYNYFTKLSECSPLIFGGNAKPENFPEYVNYDYIDFHGAGAGLRKDMLENLGYFDNDLFFYGNEQDLSSRALIAGYEIKYFSNIVFFHKQSPQNRQKPRNIYFGVRNFNRWANRYLPFKTRINFVCGLILMNLYSLLSSLVKKEGGLSPVFISLFRASVISFKEIFFVSNRNILNQDLLFRYQPYIDHFTLTSRIKKHMRAK